uniref:Fatty acid hydroxylase domain-containing protein n=1 Tax=Brassica campestris TaxID=3711 RepID=A0A3P5ZZ16_BRACM|nr:unnamed protein product [Brassica rapa]
MASRPGLLTDWPWTPLGSFKYLVVVPLVIDSIYSYATMRDMDKLLIVAVMVGRIVHSQMWISYARYKTAKGTKRIVNKSIEFDQVDRERTWDDQVIFNTLIVYLTKVYVLGTNTVPFWRVDGVVQVALLHAGPVEFIYYWFHRVPLPLLSLPFTPPLIHRHRAHHFGGTSVCGAHWLYTNLGDTSSNDFAMRHVPLLHSFISLSPPHAIQDKLFSVHANVRLRLWDQRQVQ